MRAPLPSPDSIREDQSQSVMIAALPSAEFVLPSTLVNQGQGPTPSWRRKRSRSDDDMDTADDAMAPDDADAARDAPALLPPRQSEACSSEVPCSMDDMDSYLNTPTTADVMADVMAAS